MRSRVHITSFGYLHGPPPEALLTVDVRTLFRDPHIDPAMRELTGLDRAVVERVMSQDGARAFVARFSEAISGLSLVHSRLTVALGCAGGRHRSVVMVNEFGKWQEAFGFGTPTVVHRDIDKPVVTRDGSAIQIPEELSP